MNKYIKQIAFILALAALTGCGTENGTASTPEESSANDTNVAEEEIRTELNADDILASEEFESAFHAVTDPESADALGIEADMSDAYIGTPFYYANMNADGTFSMDDSLHFLVMKDGSVTALIHFSIQDNGAYDYSTSGAADFGDKVNELISTGTQYAMVIAEDGEVGFAVSEDDELHLIYDYTYSDETDLSPDITFEEARKFGSVISLESLTTQVYP